jgi:hypothetical protein
MTVGALERMCNRVLPLGKRFGTSAEFRLNLQDARAGGGAAAHAPGGLTHSSRRPLWPERTKRPVLTGEGFG